MLNYDIIIKEFVLAAKKEGFVEIWAIGIPLIKNRHLFIYQSRKFTTQSLT
jgi:hypothetical protein